MRRAVVLLVGAVLVAGWPLLPASGQASFAGKTVTLVVGFPPGGGYDRLARIVARHLPRYLPGAPTVVVQNMPGAGSLMAANHVYHVLRSDGFTLGLFNRNLVLAQLAGVEGMRVDLRQWNWVASLAQETSVLAVRADLPYRHVLDLRRADPPPVIGATGTGDITYQVPLMYKVFLRLNLRIVTGYSGSPEIFLAIEKKEADGIGISWTSLRPYAQRGLLRPLLRSLPGTPRDPELRDVPVAAELVTDPVGRAVPRLQDTPDRMARAFVAPPGADPALVRLYREAFQRMAADREFTAEVERAGFEPAFLSGEQCRRLVEEVLRTPPSVVRVFKELFRFGG
jgi:tripartite-type tricarboxylate transporter receptor subunit TctC